MFSKDGPVADSRFEPVPVSSKRSRPGPSEESRERDLCLSTLLAGGERARRLFEGVLRPLVQKWISPWLKGCRETEEVEGDLWLELARSSKVGDAPSNSDGLERWVRKTLHRLRKRWARKGRAERRQTVLLAGRDPEDPSRRGDDPLESRSHAGIGDILRLLPRPEWRLVLRLRTCEPKWRFGRIARRYGVESVTTRTWNLRARRFLRRIWTDISPNPSEYVAVHRGRGYAVVRRRLAEVSATPCPLGAGSATPQPAPAIKESKPSSR